MRNRRLDALRCIAVVLVLFNHSGIHGWLTNVGWCGVDLFFVLSGFLISGLLFKEYKTARSIHFKRFFIRRGFKIYPSFYVFLFATIPIQLGIFRGFPFKRYLAESLYVQNYAPSVWAHTWSLAVEEHFYILLPILLLLLMRFSRDRENPFRTIPVVFVVVAGLCLFFRIATALHIPNSAPAFNVMRAVYEPTHERIDSLFFGVLLGYLHHFRPAFLRRVTSSRANVALLGGGSLALVLWVLSLPRYGWIMTTVGFTLLYLGFGTLLVLCLYGQGFGSLASNWWGTMGKVLGFVGMYSYSIYLWHLAVQAAIPSLTRKLFHLRLGSASDSFLYFLVSIAFGIVMSRAIEYPLLHVRDALFPSMVPDPSISTSPTSGIPADRVEATPSLT